MGVEGISEQADGFKEALVNEIGKKFREKAQNMDFFSNSANNCGLIRCLFKYKNGRRCATFFRVDAKNNLACTLHRPALRKQQTEEKLAKLETEDIVRQERLRDQQTARQAQLQEIRQKTSRKLPDSTPMVTPTASEYASKGDSRSFITEDALARQLFPPVPPRVDRVPSAPPVTTNMNATATTVTTNIIPPILPPPVAPIIAPTLTDSQQLVTGLGGLNINDYAATQLASQFQQQVQSQPNLLDGDTEMGDVDDPNDYPENQDPADIEMGDVDDPKDYPENQDPEDFHWNFSDISEEDSDSVHIDIESPTPPPAPAPARPKKEKKEKNPKKQKKPKKNASLNL